MAEALARAKQRRAEAVAAQEARMAADDVRTLKNAERAKEHGLVEKTAGESGAAGRLRNKWLAFLQTGFGKVLRIGAAIDVLTVSSSVVRRFVDDDRSAATHPGLRVGRRTHAGES